MNPTVKYISTAFAVQLILNIGAIAFWSGGLEKDVKVNSTAILENKNNISITKRVIDDRITKLEDIFREDISDIKQTGQETQIDIAVIKAILGVSDVDTSDIGQVFN